MVNRKGDFFRAVLTKCGLKASADVNKSKTSVADSEANNDDFVTTARLV